MKHPICDKAYGGEVERVLRKFAETIGELQLRPNYAVLRSLANAVNGAAGRLGLPHDEAPAVRRLSPVAIEGILDGIIAEGSERGGELTL